MRQPTAHRLPTEVPLACGLQVLIDPPWEEYARRAPGAPGLDDAWPWQDIQALDIAAVADTPSFVFLWCERRLASGNQKLLQD